MKQRFSCTVGSQQKLRFRRLLFDIRLLKTGELTGLHILNHTALHTGGRFPDDALGGFHILCNIGSYIFRHI
ncbi:hypothetical protein D3C85_1697090 [compost metagenome]